jgi:hypothetical protein
MATGDNTTLVLADSLDTIAASGRSRREFEGVVPQLVDKVTLDANTGTSWNELLYEKLSAVTVDETTTNENFQRYDDSSITITPQLVQITTFITDKAKRNLSAIGLSQMGSLAGNAMMRKKDDDGITALDTSAIELGTTGTPISVGDVAAARYRISSNATERGGITGISCVAHGFVIKDMFDELTAGVGTYPIPEGSTARVFTGGFNLPIAGVAVLEDGNIPFVNTTDAKSYVFAKEAWVLVSGMTIKTELERMPRRGGGGDAVTMTDEFAYGQRSAGNWSVEILADATAPS